MLLSCGRWLKSKLVYRRNHTEGTQQAGPEYHIITSAKALGLAVKIKCTSLLT